MIGIILALTAVATVAYLGFKHYAFIEHIKATTTVPIIPYDPEVMNWLSMFGWREKPGDESRFVGLQRWFKKYPKKIFWVLYPRPTVYVTDPGLVKEVLSIQNFPKNKLAKNLEVIAGKDMVTRDHTNPNDWKPMRKLFDPVFKKPSIRQFVPVFNKHAQRLVSAIKGDMIYNGIFTTVDRYVSRVTLDIICETAFAYDMNCMSGDNEKMFTAFTELLKAVGDLKNLIPGYVYYNKWRTQKYRDLLNEKIVDAIEKRKPHLSDEDSGVLLDIMLKDSSISMQTVLDETLMFFLAGYDTTTQLMSFLLIVLSRYPHILEKVQAEVDKLFEEKDFVSDEDQEKKLPYMTKVIKEVLRRYQVAPWLGRQVPVGGAELGGHYLPEGVTVMTPSCLLHMDPAVWKNPEEFNPDRWDEETDRALHSFVPFMAGGRICLGMHFAWSEVRILLAHLVRNFVWYQKDELQYAPLYQDWHVLSGPLFKELVIKLRVL